MIAAAACRVDRFGQIVDQRLLVLIGHRLGELQGLLQANGHLERLDRLLRRLGRGLDRLLHRRHRVGAQGEVNGVLAHADDHLAVLGKQLLRLLVVAWDLVGNVVELHVADLLGVEFYLRQFGRFQLGVLLNAIEHLLRVGHVGAGDEAQ